MKTKVTAALLSLGLVFGFSAITAAPASAASYYSITTNSSYVASKAAALNGGRVTCNGASVANRTITVTFINSSGRLVTTVSPKTGATGVWQVYSSASAGLRYRVSVSANGVCGATTTAYKTVARSPFQPA